MGWLDKLKTSLRIGASKGRRGPDEWFGMEFSATLELRTPLSVLKKHGAIHEDSDTPPPQYAAEEWQGGWAPKGDPKFDFLRGGTAMSSIVGPIPYDGGDFMPFLISVREVVEVDAPVEERRKNLHELLDRTKWPYYVTALGGADKIIDHFFPSFLKSIGGLTQAAIEQLNQAGMNTAAALVEASDETLLQIKGVGPAKLKGIRSACELAADKHAVWLDVSSSRPPAGVLPRDPSNAQQITSEYINRDGDQTRTGFLLLAAIAADSAKSAIEQGRHDDAWRYLSEEKMNYMKHANQVGLSAREILKLDGSVSVMQANILKLEGKHHDALVHVIYRLATQGEEVTERQEHDIKEYFDRCKFTGITFDVAKNKLRGHPELTDFRKIQALVKQWRDNR